MGFLLRATGYRRGACGPAGVAGVCVFVVAASRLDEIDRVEARAPSHRVESRLGDSYVDELRTVAAWRQHDRRAPE